MAKNGHILGSVGGCHDCDKVFENQIHARRDAAQHSIKTGHETSVEVTRYFKYKGKKS